ncbi:MAG: VanW family protein [Cyclobacteriaceae bacterium]
MFNYFVSKPIVRSKIRRKLGRKYYSLKRRIIWLSNKSNYATTIVQDQLPYIIREHKSLLLRPLKDVDMQLQHNKITNLRLAIQHINGLIIEPGEIFSLWFLVGKPTKKKGYLEGLVLNQGKIESDIGGGLCQLGNLLFWMILHSPLTITERYRHGFDVFPDVNRKVPFGAGATLAYNYIDFQVKNNTKEKYQIELFLDKEYLNGKVRSEQTSNERFEVYESDHRIVHQSWGGYTRHNKICRKRFDEKDKLISDETLLENHAIMMYEPLLES